MGSTYVHGMMGNGNSGIDIPNLSSLSCGFSYRSMQVLRLSPMHYVLVGAWRYRLIKDISAWLALNVSIPNSQSLFLLSCLLFTRARAPSHTSPYSGGGRSPVFLSALFNTHLTDIRFPSIRCPVLPLFMQSSDHLSQLTSWYPLWLNGDFSLIRHPPILAFHPSAFIKLLYVHSLMPFPLLPVP